jgi:hypothetical protein
MKMTMKIIKVLLLEDMSDDFSEIENIVEKISEELVSKGIKLELLYNYDCSLKLISNFVASKKMEVNLQKPFKDIVSKKVEQIKNESMLICLLDIVWTKDAKNKTSSGEKDEYGSEFYCEYLNKEDINKNTIIVSALKRLPQQMRNMPLVSKLYGGTPFGENYRKKLKKTICSLPIVQRNMLNNYDNINPHTEKGR